MVFFTLDVNSVYFVFYKLTIEVSKAHADCNHQSQYDASVKATTELAFVLLFPRRFRLWFSRWPLLSLGAGDQPLLSPTFSYCGTGLIARFITTWFIIASLRRKNWKPEQNMLQNALIVALKKSIWVPKSIIFMQHLFGIYLREH